MKNANKIYDNFNDLKAPLWKDLIDILDGWVSREQSKTRRKCKENNMHCKWKQVKIAKKKEMQGMKCKHEWLNLTFSDLDLYTHVELAKLLCTLKVIMKVCQTCKVGVHTQGDDESLSNLQSWCAHSKWWYAKLEKF